MITKDQAVVIATQHLDEMSKEAGVECAIMVVQDEDFGWVFVYQGKAYVEFGDERGLMVGNAPILIDKWEGKIHPTGTAYPVAYYVKKYREEWRDKL